MHATCPTHILLYFMVLVIVFGEEYKFCTSSLCNLQPPIISSLLGRHILLSTVLKYPQPMFFSLNVRNQISLPYKTTGKIVFDIYIYICVCVHIPPNFDFLNQSGANAWLHLLPLPVPMYACTLMSY
jgi:hypothetical protein